MYYVYFRSLKQACKILPRHFIEHPLPLGYVDASYAANRLGLHGHFGQCDGAGAA